MTTTYQLAEVNLIIPLLRKSNSQRAIPIYTTYWRSMKRKFVETIGSVLEQLIPKPIHASTGRSLEIKLMSLMLALSFKLLFN
jgi:hypothetical protein